MKTIQTIDIVGLGALGTMYADFFVKKLGFDKVRILGNAARIERYQNEKVFFNDEECVFPFKVSELEKEPSQLLLFCVKYGALGQAMQEVAHLVGENTIIASVLNGIRSEEELAEKFGADKVIYCTAQKMAALKEGNRAVSSFLGEWSLGIIESGKQENLQALMDFLDKVDFPYNVPKDIRRALWSKLICNVGVNQTVSFYEGTYSCVQKQGEARNMMRDAMRECVQVAQKEGIDLSEEDVIYWMDVIDHLSANGEPSMRQDAKAGRKTEVELFAGTICELGKMHKIATPVNDIFLNKWGS